MDLTEHEFCNTGTEEETLALQKKRARRVSFADITSVHVFDRDEDSQTPTTSKSTPDSTSPNHSFSTLGFAKASPGSGDSKEECYNHEGQDDDDDDDEEDERKSFLRPIHSPSPGSTLGSNTSNDDDNFFGPVSSSFIRPRKLSDSEELDENHDITMDSTAFSMHFHSLARSDSGGCAVKTPTMTRLTFEEKTPTQNTGYTNVGSSMELVPDDTQACGSSAPVNSIHHSCSPNDMSLVGENSRKYDFENLSPELDALLAEGNNESVEGSCPDGKNVITMPTENSRNILEKHVRDDSGGIPIITTPNNISVEKQSASLDDLNLSKKESSPSIPHTFSFLSSSVTPKFRTPTHAIKETSLYQGHQVIKAALEKSRLGLISAVNTAVLSPRFNVKTQLNMQHDHEKSNSLEKLVEEKLEKVEKHTFSNPREMSHTVISTPLSTDLRRKVFLDSAVLSDLSTPIHFHGNSTLSFDKEFSKIGKTGVSNEDNFEASSDYFSRNSSNAVLEDNKIKTPQGFELKHEHQASPKKRDEKIFADGRFYNIGNVSQSGEGEDLIGAELFQQKFSDNTLDMERPTKLMRTSVSSFQYTSIERKDDDRALGMVKTPVENKNFKSFPPVGPITVTDLISRTDPSRISRGKRSFFGSDSVHAHSKSFINKKIQASPPFEESEKGQGIGNSHKGINIFYKMQEMGNFVGRMQSSAFTETEVHRTESHDMKISPHDPWHKSCTTMKNEGPKSFRNWSDLFTKLSVCGKQLISPNIHKLNIQEISQIEDAFRKYQMIKTKEILSFDISSQKFNDPVLQARQKRIWQSRLLQDKVLSELAKGQLLSIKKERLLNRVQFLTRKVEECQNLKVTLLNHSNSLRIECHQMEGNHNLSYVVEDEKVYRDKVQRLSGEVEDSNRKIKDYLKFFPEKYTANEKNADIVESLKDFIEKLDRCSILRHTMQLWCIDNAESRDGHHNILLNYCNLLFQSMSMTVGLASTTVTISNKLNTAEISKRFSGMEACTAFEFLFGNTTRKQISRLGLPGQTQVTSSLLSNLLDVVEELKLARLELKNLIRSRFFCPSGKQLSLELWFVGAVGGIKAVLTLDMSTLKSGVYPEDVLPLCTEVVGGGGDAWSHLSVEKMKAAMAVGLDPGYFRVLRLCRLVSSYMLSHSLLTPSTSL